MNKNRLSLIILIILLTVVIALCGIVVAYMFRQTEYKDNLFTPASVSCKVHEVTDTDVMKKTSIKIENTGNIDAYLRIRFVSYWVQVTDSGEAEIVAKSSVMPELETADGWVKGSDHTYYYKSPVAPDGFTGELLASELTLAEEDGYKQVVEIFAEAIQSRPADPVTDSWGVTLDENADIITAP